MITTINGMKLTMSTGTTPATVVATAITAAAAAVVTAADTTGMADGQLVRMSGTGMASLDGKLFIVAALSSTSFSLTGSDATGETAAGTVGTATYYVDPTDMVSICGENLTPNRDAPTTVPTPTWCNPTGSVPGPAPSAGDMVIDMFLDKDDPGYCALVKAEKDALERVFNLEIPNQSSLVFSGVVSLLDITFPSAGEGGPAKVAATIALSTAAAHRFDCPVVTP